MKIDEHIPREARGEFVTMFERTESMRKAFAHNTLLSGLLSSLQDSDKKQVLRKMMDQKVLPMKLALDPKIQFMTDKFLNSRGCLRAAKLCFEATRWRRQVGHACLHLWDEHSEASSRFGARGELRGEP